MAARVGIGKDTVAKIWADHELKPWAEHWNNNPTPFIWKATAEDIITKVKRGRETLHQIKTQTDHY